MRDLIRIEDAIAIMEMMLAGRMSEKERRDTRAAIADLRLALVDPEICAAMHVPHEERTRACVACPAVYVGPLNCPDCPLTICFSWQRE